MKVFLSFATAIATAIAIALALSFLVINCQKVFFSFTAHSLANARQGPVAQAMGFAFGNQEYRVP